MEYNIIVLKVWVENNVNYGLEILFYFKVKEIFLDYRKYVVK